MFAEVIFNRPIPPYTYEIPERFRDVKPGLRVEVDLGGSHTVGIVYRILEKSGVKGLKPLLNVLDSSPVLNDDLFKLAEWISNYYMCSVGEACWTMIPKGIKKRDVNVDYGLDEKQRPVRSENIKLTPDQKSVVDRLVDAVEKNENRVFLLHGVTGSGKTEVYLRVIDRVIKKGLGAILLVPEISLTPQTVRYFTSRFGEKLAVLHSRLTKAEKVNEWYRILRGEKPIVIGARSAIFAPLKRIGAIIVDEEHETSYKSDETPRYNAKSVAYYRTRMHGGVLILGSATPSVESYHLAKRGVFTLLELPNRVMNNRLPATKITDLRRSRNSRFLSKALVKAIDDRLRKNEQVILFLNRRGFSSYIFCEDCGHVIKCKNCDISMTYHRDIKKLVCHYCGYSIDPPDLCPNCGSEKLSFSGFGTERIESILKDIFPAAAIVRMDTDTVKRRRALSEILNAFAKKKIDILIGTQIVTKGLHFPDVTLVGVLNADIALNFPDFRAAERTFDLITQVAGRAGRGEKVGEVIIQTYNPSHYAIQTAKNHDYTEFFLREVKFRQAMNYPPFTRIIRLVFRGKNQDKLFDVAGACLDILVKARTGGDDILGPASCPLSKIKQNYRVHVIIKTNSIGTYRNVLVDIGNRIKKIYDVYLEIDIDPISML